jgi:hypothetical protein
VDDLIKQTRQPQFISSAYFLRFKFDAGRYALVGREKLEGQDVLRIEYYPQTLFADDRKQRPQSGEQVAGGARDRQADVEYEKEMRRLMNKASRVTLWVEPASHQIVKYRFDDLGWDFLPGQWLVRVTNVQATMTMAQPFPDVWLPRSLEMNIGMGLAVGDVNLRYALEYRDYRRAEVTTRIGVPGAR